MVASLKIETLPVILPGRAGAKVTLKLVFWPVAKVSGRDRSRIVKPLPVTVACEIVTLVVPVLVRITGSTLFVPSATFPKSLLVGFAVT